MASHRENASAVPASASVTSQFEQAFGIRNATILRQGLGFGSRREREETREREMDGAEDTMSDYGHDEEDPMIPIDPNDPERSRMLREAYANEARLRADLRAAGLI
jgi:hypothetical protein